MWSTLRCPASRRCASQKHNTKRLRESMVCLAIDVTILRLQSLSVQVPPWGFQEVAGHLTELSEEEVPQWRCCFETECEAYFGSFQALVTHVLRHHRQMETVSRLVVTNECPACRAVYGDRKCGSSSLAVIDSSWVLS